jgi:hypothetical protein
MAYEMQGVALAKLYELAIARLNSATQIATTAIQSLLLINGGAIVAVLGLLAQGKNASILAGVYLPTVLCGIMAFALAVGLTLLASICGHDSQARMSGVEVQEAERFYQTAEFGRSAEEVAELEIANRHFVVGVWLVIASVILFLIGGAYLAWAFLAPLW